MRNAGTFALVAVTLWSLAFPLIKMSLEEVKPIALAVIRYAFALLPLTAIIILMRKRHVRFFDLTGLRLYMMLSTFSIVIPNITQNVGMLYTTAGMAAILQSLSPIFTVILASVHLKEDLNSGIIIGSAMAVLATVFIFSDDLNAGRMTVLGNLLMIVTALSYSLAGLILKKTLRRHDPLSVLIATTALGTLLLLPVSLIFEPSGLLGIGGASIRTWNVIIVLSLLTTAIAPILWYHALRIRTLTSMSLLTYLIPFLAVLFSMFLLKESISSRTAFFGAILILGVFIAEKNAPKELRTKKL